MLNVLIRNISSNWAGFAVQAAITFFLTPFVLNSLGEVRYGIWALVIGLTGYYGILELGCRAGMTQYMTRYFATRDFDRLNETASTGLVALTACSALLLPATVLLVLFAPRILTIPADAVIETRACLLIIGTSVAIQFPWYTFSSVFAVTQRFDIANVVGISTSLLTGFATFLALKLGYGLIGLSLVQVAGNQLGYAIRWRLAYRILPELEVTPLKANRQSFWPIVAFGSWSFVVTSASRLKYNANTIIIGLLMPVSALAPYALAQGLIAQFEKLFVPIGNVFFPAITHLDAQGDAVRLRRVYLAGSKLLLLFASTSGMIAAACASDFYRLWLGERALQEGSISLIAGLFCILIVGSVFVTMQAIGNQIFYGTRKLKQLGVLVACEGVTNIILSVCLIRSLGLLGVALAIVGSSVLFQGVLNPILVCRTLGVDWKAYLRIVCMRPLLVAVILGALLVFVRKMFWIVSAWEDLFAQGLIIGAPALLLIVIIGLDGVERQKLVIQPIVWLCGQLAPKKISFPGNEPLDQADTLR